MKKTVALCLLPSLIAGPLLRLDDEYVEVDDGPVSLDYRHVSDPHPVLASGAFVSLDSGG